MSRHGLGGDEQLLRDLAVRRTIRDELGDLELAGGQRSAGLLGRRIQPDRVREVSELTHAGLGRALLRLGGQSRGLTGAAAAHRAARQVDERLHPLPDPFALQPRDLRARGTRGRP